jgi:hypothetical protein
MPLASQKRRPKIAKPAGWTPTPATIEALARLLRSMAKAEAGREPDRRTGGRS